MHPPVPRGGNREELFSNAAFLWSCQLTDLRTLVWNPWFTRVLVGLRGRVPSGAEWHALPCRRPPGRR